MWRRLVLARQLVAPFAFLLVSAIAVGWYAWSWIPEQQQYFANRNLRSLSSLGESLAATINNLDHVLDNAVASGLAARALPDYFKSQVPNVLVAGANERASHNDLFGTFERREWLRSDWDDAGASIYGELLRTLDVNDKTAPTSSQLQAEPCYPALWKNCTKDEQLALIQLAEEGLLNPKCTDIASRLFARGLIVCDCVPKLMNDTFKQFVLRAVPRDTVAQWELDERIPWSSVIFVGVMGLTVFLFFTQQDLAKNWVAYIGAIAGAVPALFTAFMTIRSMSSRA